MKINFNAYGEHVNDTLANDDACSATIFSADNSQIDGMIPLRASSATHLTDKPKRRARESRQAVFGITDDAWLDQEAVDGRPNHRLDPGGPDGQAPL